MAGEVANSIVTARKPHVCEGDRPRHTIEPGRFYVRTVMFPGDVNSSGRPWVMRICITCWGNRPMPGDSDG